MTTKEKKLAFHMLKIASIAFSNHVCNDVHDSVYAEWTLEERQQFVKEFHDWNGDPKEFNPKFLHLGDFVIMAFLAHKYTIQQPSIVGDDVMFSLPDIRNKLSPIKNLIAMLENGLVKSTVESDQLIIDEINQCKESIAYLSKDVF